MKKITKWYYHHKCMLQQLQSGIFTAAHLKTKAFLGKISQILSHYLKILSHYPYSFSSPKFPTSDPSGFLIPTIFPASFWDSWPSLFPSHSLPSIV